MTQSKKAGRVAKVVQDESFARTNFGAFLRAQRRLAGLTLRQLADVSSVSNAYLSQIERGHHKPSIDVLRSVARGLNVSVEMILDQVGLFEDPHPDAERESARVPLDTEAAIRTDPRIDDAQREALLIIYRSYVAANKGVSVKGKKAANKGVGKPSRSRKR